MIFLFFWELLLGFAGLFCLVVLFDLKLAVDFRVIFFIWRILFLSMLRIIVKFLICLWFFNLAWWIFNFLIVYIGIRSLKHDIVALFLGYLLAIIRTIAGLMNLMAWQRGVTRPIFELIQLGLVGSKPGCLHSMSKIWMFFRAMAPPTNEAVILLLSSSSMGWILWMSNCPVLNNNRNVSTS